MTTHTNKPGGVRCGAGISMMLILAGCGGGDSGNDSQALAITSANAASVTAKVFDTSFNVAGVGTNSAAIAAASLAPLADNGDRRRFKLPDLINENLQKTILTQPASPAMAAAIVSGREVACEISGNFNYTWNDKDDNNQLSVGDNISGLYNNCADLPGVSISGGLSYALNALTGDPSLPLTAWSTSETISFDQLRITEGNETRTLHGNGLSFTSSTHDGVSYSYSLSGATLNLTDAQDTSTLSNFALFDTEDENTLAYTLHVRGIVSSAKLDGSVSFATTQLFKGTDNGTPTEGRMTIHGAKINGASPSGITLTAMSGDDVRLEIDTSGDGVADETIDTTWSQLGIAQ